MITLLIIISLIIGVFVGYRRSLVLQSMHLIGTIIALLIASLNFAKFSDQLRLILPYPSASTEANNIFFKSINNEDGFYNIMAVLILFITAKIIINIGTYAFDFYHQMNFGGRYARQIGMVLGLIESFFIIACILITLAIIPIPIFYNALQSSWLGNVIITKTPILSDLFINWLSH